MSWLAIIGTVLSLAYTIFQEIFSRAAEKRKEDAAFKLSEELALKIAQEAISKMLDKLAKDSDDSKRMDDEMEKARKEGISKQP